MLTRRVCDHTLSLFAAAALAVLGAGCGATAPAAPDDVDSGGAGLDARKSPSYPAFAGAVDLRAGRWDRLVEGTVDPLHNNPAGLLVEPMPIAADASRSINYLFSPLNRSLAGARSIEVDFELTATGTPIFHHDGGPGGLLPNVRPFFWSFNLRDYQTPSARWWSQTSWTLAPGRATLSVSLDPATWSNVYGAFGSTVPAEFAAARAATVAIGLTFGGGSSFGHGVSITNGTADFVVRRFEVR